MSSPLRLVSTLAITRFSEANEFKIPSVIFYDGKDLRTPKAVGAEATTKAKQKAARKEGWIKVEQCVNNSTL